MQIAWMIFGILSFSLGAIGAFVPLLPTVPLMLLAAFCFSKSSTRLHNWLLSHPKFGAAIADWNAHGAISPFAKRLASVSIAATFVISLLVGVGGGVLAVQAIVLSGVLIFIWTRPAA